MDDVTVMNDRIRELEDKLAKEQAKNKREMTLKVSEKGAVQINGIRRFPITLYKSEMNKILDNAGTIMEFMRDNDEFLAKPRNP
tara:strand:+ start:16277 stop:16528 length:252 start_codon:yes stop_codon:yes gene_type:complete